MLLDDWIRYFSMLYALKDVVFARSIVPEDWDRSVQPTLVTFGDGNEQAFGSVAFAIWTLLNGERDVRLIMSKAKLGPLLHKGDVIRHELGGATFSARLKTWIFGETNVKYGDSFHFLDSQIVQAMINNKSYGFNTYAGLRLAEIENTTGPNCEEKWMHISTKQNIADVLTKGCSPEKLGPGSIWQCGPSWLKDDIADWPVNQRKEQLSPEESLEFKRFRKQGLPNEGSISSIALYSLQSPKDGDSIDWSKMMFDQLMERCSTLERLLNVFSFVLR